MIYLFVSIYLCIYLQFPCTSIHVQYQPISPSIHLFTYSIYPSIYLSISIRASLGLGLQSYWCLLWLSWADGGVTRLHADSWLASSQPYADRRLFTLTPTGNLGVWVSHALWRKAKPEDRRREKRKEGLLWESSLVKWEKFILCLLSSSVSYADSGNWPFVTSDRRPVILSLVSDSTLSRAPEGATRSRLLHSKGIFRDAEIHRLEKCEIEFWQIETKGNSLICPLKSTRWSGETQVYEKDCSRRLRPESISWSV